MDKQKLFRTHQNLNFLVEAKIKEYKVAIGKKTKEKEEQLKIKAQILSDIEDIKTRQSNDTEFSDVGSQKNYDDDVQEKPPIEPYRDSKTRVPQDLPPPFPETTRSMMVSGNISKITESSLCNYFSKYGKIVNFSDTSRAVRSSGWKFVFIKFSDPSSVDKAIGENS